MLQAVRCFDPALAVADPDIVDHSVEWTQAIGLLGDSSCFGDAGHIADDDGRCLGRRRSRIFGAVLVAGVQRHLVTRGQQALAGRESQAVR